MAPGWLREIFARFLRQRRIARHFRRLALFESLAHTQVSRELPSGLAQQLIAAATQNEAALLHSLGSHSHGLTEQAAANIRKTFGLNQVEHEKPLGPWLHLWHCYSNPFSLLLTLLALISYVTHDYKAASVIALMILLATALRFWQESKSNKAADALKAMVSNTATVIRRDISEDAAIAFEERYGAHLHPRGPRQLELPITQLVPGDIVVLSAGDMIPADCRLLSAKDLFIGQAAMTGESMPVEKFAQVPVALSANPLELGNLVFMGTNVVSGTATALVLNTGSRTYFGALARRVTAVERAPTAFQAGVNQISWLLIRFMAVMVPLVFLINGFSKHDWLEALLFALSIAVGLTPEMLPMIATSTLAKGAVFLARKKVIVKRLDAIQNFGAMDILCTDKTGTLTQDKIILSQHLDAWGKNSNEVLAMAYINSYYQTGLKNLLDVAVLEHADAHSLIKQAEAMHKIDEIPFDFLRRRMSVVVAGEDNNHLLICKGALEEVLSVCTQVRRAASQENLTPELLQQLTAVTAQLNGQGLRVVAVAVKQLPPAQTVYSVQDESALTLIGYVAFLDPPKDSTAPALNALAQHGVKVKVLTGDNELVTAKICSQVGLVHNGCLLGSAIEIMSDSELAQAVETNTLFAKLSPAHKERIVRSLKSNGHVVGFMGDGINDAPALHAADIGISVDTAVDIAKAAADIILLEKSLLVLDQGVLEGRRTFVNMLKYIKMTVSSNFGNVFSVLVASIFIPFLPMLPMHLLLQNLLYDISQIAIPFDHVDDELIARPQYWQPAAIGRFMIFFGPVSSVFDLITFAFMWFVLGANSIAQKTLFQSGWFVVGLLTQTLIVHMIRTAKMPFVDSRASMPLMVMTCAIIALGVAIPMSPFAHYFKLQALPPLYFLFLPAVVLAYMGMVQAMKSFYIHRYRW